ncbi:hypothetical protein LJC32_05760 [Oscillospiraceae bacterium OttesenSCG-928-F05]|nr:hypothetical protein [Oscillospiraceae bacterium OttesenSCG-928-F05]
MQMTIGKRLMILMLLPFLLLSGIYSAAAILGMYRGRLGEISAGLDEAIKLKSALLSERIGSVQTSVAAAASAMEAYDTEDTAARERSIKTLLGLFDNAYIHNVWLAFEPDAFGGKDIEHQGEYAGAPSGRFLRAFVKKCDDILPVTGMDEALFENPGANPWYSVPLETGRPYVAIESRGGAIDTSSVDTEHQGAVTITVPVRRGGVAVGCVGADILIDALIGGVGGNSSYYSAVFSETGYIVYADEEIYLNWDIAHLNFGEEEAVIRQAFEDQAPLELEEAHTVFFGEKAVTRFEPVTLREADTFVMIYMASPISLLQEDMLPLLIQEIASGVAVLAIAGILFAYVSKTIAVPLKRLNREAESIALEQFDGARPKIRTTDEIGALTETLRQIEDKLRNRVTVNNRAHLLLLIGGQMLRVMRESRTVGDAMAAAAEIFCTGLDLDRVTCVLVDPASATIIACHEAALGRNKRQEGPFQAHAQMKQLIGEKTCVYLNACALGEACLPCFEEETASACILPVRVEGELRAYVMMESRKPALPLIHDDFTPGRLSAMLEEIVRLEREAGEGCEEAPELRPEAEPEKPAEAACRLMDAARTVPGLEVDSGFEISGEDREIYERLLRLLPRHIIENTERLRTLVDTDIQTFAVTVHGLKGALNNLGARELGKRAEMLEKAAKTGNVAYCIETYPAFEQALFDMGNAIARLAEDGRAPTEAGDMDKLWETMEKVKAACAAYDSVLAFDLVAPLTEWTFGQRRDYLIGEIRYAAETFDCDRAVELIEALLACAEV